MVQANVRVLVNSWHAKKPFSSLSHSCLPDDLYCVGGDVKPYSLTPLVSLLQNFYFKPPEGQECIEVDEVWGGSLSPTAYKVRMVVRDA